MFSALGLFFLCSKGIMQYLRGDKNILTNWNFLLNTNRRVEKRKRKKLCPGLKPSLNCLPPLTPTEFEMFLQHSNKYVQCARILGLELRTKVGTEDTFLEESAWSRWVRFQKWIMSTGREHNVEEEMAWGRATHTHKMSVLRIHPTCHCQIYFHWAWTETQHSLAQHLQVIPLLSPGWVKT